jgi:DNA mismatch endonuclease (patch repair protein)
MMSGIRGKDTKPEMLLRRGLHALGLRYRLHVPELAGKPDLVFPRWKAVIFVNGCFWHRHPGCRYTMTPATRREFWERKFAANVARDEANQHRLLENGWRVLVVWECGLKKSAVHEIVHSSAQFLRDDSSKFLELPVRESSLRA